MPLIIKTAKCFVQLSSYFDLYASLLILVLPSRQKNLTWIDLFFVSNIFQSLVATENIRYHCFFGLLSLLSFDSIWRIYAWSTPFEAFFMKFIKRSINEIKHIFFTLHFCKAFWYLWNWELKSSVMISSVFYPTIISRLKLVIKIPCFLLMFFDHINSSLFVSWALPSLEILRLFIRYCQTFWTYCSIVNFWAPSLLYLVKSY